MQVEEEGVFDKEIRVFRGSSWSIPFELSSRSGTPINITSATITFTVNSEWEPINTNNEQFAAAGSVVSGPLGTFEVTPSAVNTDITPGTYYWDVLVDAPSGKRRPAKGTFIVLQGIGQ
jgi:hypothetical protein